MTAPLTPGAYLKARRAAYGLSLADAAARLGTDPAIPEHDRAAWLARIEADVSPAGPTTIEALSCVYRFDRAVLATLAAIARGDDRPAPQLCRICACSDRDACVEQIAPGVAAGCAWARHDLCTACATDVPQAIGVAA